MINSEFAIRKYLEPYGHVGDPAWLRAHNLFVAEGRFLVDRLVAASRFGIHSILLTPSAAAAEQDALPADIPIYVADPTIVHAVTGFNFHRGCLALASRPAEPPLDAFLTARRVIGLEGVGNPDNVGGIFRVAAAFGVEGVLLDATCGDPLYRKAVRTSMGAALHVPFARTAAWEEALGQLKASGIRILALTPRSDARPIDELDPGDRWILLAGAEGHGLSDAALAAADERLRIPTSAAVDSLNVTVALGIALSRLVSNPA